MRIPDIDIPIQPVFFPWEVVVKAERAAEKVLERMRRAAEALKAADVPFVVIGGNAVGVWVATRDEGAVRNTRDVDILLDRRDLKRAEEAMSKAGFDLTEVNGVTVFLDRADPMPSRGVHVFFAGEKIRPHHPTPAPPVTVGTMSRSGVPAIDLRELLILKLIAFRDRDRVHIRDLIGVGLVDMATLEIIPQELRPRLKQILDDPDG